MGLPGHLKKARGIVDEPVPVIESSIDYFDIITDGSRIHYAKVGDQTVEFIPLTIAEEQEIVNDGSPPEQQLLSRLYLMVAKAMNHHIRSGLKTLNDMMPWEPSSAPVLKAVTMAYSRLPSTYQVEIMDAIGQVMANEGQAVEDLAKLLEKDHFKEKHSGYPRKRNELDGHIGFYHVFRQSPYTYHDIAQMTRLQFRYYYYINLEAQMRGSNDHNFLLNKGAPKAEAKGKPKKATVGSD